ncbi:MAG TPA: 4-hydroxy-tetrahydrodipicolinate synthase [Acidimicrobiales bacterium]
MMARFGEVLTAMVTPFRDDLSLDLDGAATLARWLTEHGSEGLVVGGTTGEAPTLSVAEHLDLARAVREAVTVPVIVGTGSNDTAHAIEMTKRAAELGADAALVVGPYYNRPPQAGIEAHYRAVAAASPDLPILVYDVPGRTGRRIAHDVLVRLATEVPNIVGFKDATGDLVATARVVADTPSSFEVLSGDDALTLPMLSVGAVGVIGVATHWAGPVFGEMIASYEKGDVARARELHVRLIPSFEYSNSETVVFSMATKAMLRNLGLPVGECRPPLGPAPAGTEERARKVYEAIRV